MPEVRLIDANALKKDLSELNYDMALSIVDTQPTIEPEVRHAHWYAPVSYDPPEWCSNCNERTRWAYDDGYCPNCGAKMDGGADND